MSNKMKIEVVGSNLIGKLAPLYEKSDAKLDAQRAYIQLDPADMLVSAGVEFDIGGTPACVGQGTVRRYMIDSRVKGDRLVEFLKSTNTQAILMRICKGYSQQVNNLELWGTLDASASDAEEDLDNAIERFEDQTDLVDVVDCSEILHGGGCQSLADVWPAESTFEEALAVQRKELEKYTHCVINGDLEKELLGFARETYENDEPISKTQRAALEQRAMI